MKIVDKILLLMLGVLAVLGVRWWYLVHPVSFGITINVMGSMWLNYLYGIDGNEETILLTERIDNIQIKWIDKILSRVEEYSIVLSTLLTLITYFVTLFGLLVVGSLIIYYSL